jgi:hypothetical protein
VDYLDNEQFVANLDPFLQCLEHLLYKLLLQKTVEVLNPEALYWQHYLDINASARIPVGVKASARHGRGLFELLC